MSVWMRCAERQGNRKGRRGWSLGVIGALGSSRFENAGDGRRVGSPSRRFRAQLFSPFGRELVILGAPIVVGDSPRGGYPALALKAVERLIKRGTLDGEYAVGALAYPAGDCIAVHWL